MLLGRSSFPAIFGLLDMCHKIWNAEKFKTPNIVKGVLIEAKRTFDSDSLDCPRVYEGQIRV